MISLPHLLTTARRFVDGVCSALHSEYLEREKLASDYHNVASSLAKATSELAAEREAHAEDRAADRRALDDLDLALSNERAALSRYTQQHNKACAELSAARADLDALTNWNLQSERPCPKTGPVVITNHPSEIGRIWNPAFSVLHDQYWRHTPESLAAWKAREGGGE